MSRKYVTVRNLDTGGVSKVLASHANHPVFSKRWEIVPDGTKKKLKIPLRLVEPAVDVPEQVEEVVEEEESIEENGKGE